ncbi:uncharacterized protein PV07_05988 [Cladophialophora immunda]|uniref:Uncharacterized protein n=1 Tax=Cladophialophora immunda TaxID=569365 RepID=A0A0D2D3D0_9EURO|nr:uncharacterized protein PV07_05988 [Cladophialophora immunda]KIW30229.1 hypothetical protein PV07_05988 [Cladophialophora immunda]
MASTCYRSVLTSSWEPVRGNGIARVQDPPNSILGRSLELGFVLAAIVADSTLLFLYQRINKTSESLDARQVGLTDRQLSDLGDHAVTFRYEV